MSVVTLKRGNNILTVSALLDSGSESSYFHPTLERFGVSRISKRFQLEALSTQANGPEKVDGLLVGFDEVMILRIQALKHEGIGRSDTELQAKVSDMMGQAVAVGAI